MIIVGSILWLVCFSIWIALAAIFAPSDGKVACHVCGFILFVVLCRSLALSPGALCVSHWRAFSCDLTCLMVHGQDCSKDC